MCKHFVTLAEGCHNKVILRENIKHRIFLLSFLVLLFGNRLMAQNSAGSSVVSYSIHNGLSGNGITAIFQDSKGYIWVGTRDGLNRFDGYSFMVYRHQIKKRNSLGGNYIRCITEDTKGNIWVGTLHDGLSMWDRSSKTFLNFNSNKKDKYYFPEDNIYGMRFDTDSTLWLKTDNYLVKYNINSHACETFGLYTNIFKYSERISVPIYFTFDKHLWLGTKDGITQFNTQTNLYDRIPQADTKYDLRDIGIVTGITDCSDDNILLATHNGAFHLQENENNEYHISEINLPDGPEKTIKAVVRRRNGEAWLGTKSGIRRLTYSKKTNQYTYQSSQRKSNVLLSDYEITDLIEDKSGLIWAGTRYNGLFKIDFKPRKFEQISDKRPLIEKLDDYDIKSIYVDDDGVLWLGTGGKGLKIIDKEHHKLKNYKLNTELNDINEDALLSICEDSKKRVWLGTTQGIFIFDRQKNRLQEFSYAGNKEVLSLLKYNRINAIEEDIEGNIWFATQFGLYKYDNKRIYNYFSDQFHDNCICSDEINALYEDEDGILWIGSTEGVNYLNINKMKEESEEAFGTFQSVDDSISMLSNNYVLSISGDDKGNIWFGTRSGLTQYNKIHNTFHHYSQEDGLANDMIYGVLCDKNQNVWISTNKGISCINTESEILNFDISNGLPGYVFNKGAVDKAVDGTIYFAGADGIAYCHPDSLMFNEHKPEVVIDYIEVYHKGRRTEKLINNGEEITIKYRRSSILKVRYASLEYSEPTKNKFQVFLEGYDDDWRPITSDREVNIANIPSGKYTLWVKGTNNDLIWCDEPAKIEITVVPPIWQSTYAIAFYIIAFIFLLQTIINYRIRHYRRAYKDLEDKAEAKKNIEEQKELLSSINLRLTDSIHYAKRIQESILPSEERMKLSLHDLFVYFRPKDLVSGDFYWFLNKDNKIFVAAVDCTGHGVPGAFMSIIANDMLKSIVENSDIDCPAQILNKLNHKVNNTFKRDVTEKNLNINDGMDIALCVIDKANAKMQFAGAMNPLYLVRDNEIYTYKGDRLPIGHLTEEEEIFTTHEIALKPFDTIYIFSDGYADQFGGEDGKKFKYRRFRHLLLNIHKLPLEDQKAVLHQKMQHWMGDIEQVDDILVMGMRPLD